MIATRKIDKNLRAVTRAMAGAGVLALALTACGGGDAPGASNDSTSDPATAEATSDPATTEPIETASSTPATTAVSVELPQIDPATLDPCSLLTAEQVTAALGGPATPLPSGDSPTLGHVCAFFADADSSKSIEVGVREGYDSAAADATRAQVDGGSCSTADAPQFGPSAFEVSECDGTFRALYVLVDGGGIIVVLDLGAATTSETISDLTSMVLANAS